MLGAEPPSLPAPERSSSTELSLSFLSAFSQVSVPEAGPPCSSLSKVGGEELQLSQAPTMLLSYPLSSVLSYPPPVNLFVHKVSTTALSLATQIGSCCFLTLAGENRIPVLPGSWHARDWL